MTTQAPPSARTEFVPVLTELASGGLFETTDEAERIVGYRLLRPAPAILESNTESGIVDVFREIGLPRARQGFKLRGNTKSIDLTQEPETYPVSPQRGAVTEMAMGQFAGTLTEDGDQIYFQFLSGEEVEGVPIRVGVYAPDGYSVDDVRRFVDSLAFAE